MQNFKIYLLLLLGFVCVACSGAGQKTIYGNGEDLVYTAVSSKTGNFKIEDHYPIPDMNGASLQKHKDKDPKELLLPPRG